MKYKVGDTVLLYTWEELVLKYGINKKGSIALSTDYYWTKNGDSYIPQNRRIAITNIDEYGDIDYEEGWVFKELIKSHANEYYLQQIKDEL